MGNQVEAIEYAWTWLGRPYIWGGDDPSGIDCSGFIIEVLISAGCLPHGYDNNADGLYNKFKPYTLTTPEAGCLVFWFSGSRASHVELAVNEWQCIGASGSGQPKYTLKHWLELPGFDNFYAACTENQQQYIKGFLRHLLAEQQARDDNGFIKLRPIVYRGGPKAFCNPWLGG